MRFGDEGVPGPCADADKNRVMHALVHIGAGTVMLSDRSPGEKSPTGSNVHVTLDFDDVTDMAKKFEALAVGGKVTMPLEDTFWGAKFGTLTDAFGINSTGCSSATRSRPDDDAPRVGDYVSDW